MHILKDTLKIASTYPFYSKISDTLFSDDAEVNKSDIYRSFIFSASIILQFSTYKSILN